MIERNLVDNLSLGLTDLQMEDVGKAMVDMCTKEGLNPAHLKAADSALHTKLLPYLLKRSPEWKGLEKNIEWEGSRAFSHFKNHVNNCLGAKGTTLAKKLTPKKETPQVPPSSDSDSEPEEP